MSSDPVDQQKKGHGCFFYGCLTMVILAVLLRRLVPSLAPGPHGSCVPGLSLRPRDGLFMRLTRRRTLRG